MRKRLALLLLLKLSGLWLHNATAQSQLSFENYYSMSTSGPLNMMPVASFQSGKGFYAEGRYNYEELNTLSFYMGRTFSKESDFSYSVSPVAGIVIGQFNGGSVGANISMGYKNFYLYAQPQYTFAVENSINNFIYSWTDITYSPLSWLSVGVSLQHTKPKQAKGFLENGIVIETAFKKFTFPVYVFNPQSKNRSIILGANFEVNFRKKKISDKQDDGLNDIYPVKIIARTVETDKKLPAEAQIKTMPENVVKIRRVNVLVRQKIEGNIPEESKAVENKVTPEQVIKAPLPLIESTKVNTIPQKEAAITLINPGNENPTSIKAGSQAVASEKTIQNAGNSIYYALIVGPFKNENDALTIQSRINTTFNRDVILYTEGMQYKLRIPGFESYKEAEMFSVNTASEGSVSKFAIISYKLKSIEAIPLKSTSKPFEATQL